MVLCCKEKAACGTKKKSGNFTALPFHPDIVKGEYTTLGSTLLSFTIPLTKQTYRV